MHPTRHLLESVTSEKDKPLVTPPFFTIVAVLGCIGVLAVIAAAWALGPASDPLFHFGENGAITALSSVSLAMAAILSAAIFYLQMGEKRVDTLFWFMLAGGCLFLSLDEQLQFHERGGALIAAAGAGESGIFRNWNDLIVICYGLLALSVAALFRREILRCRAFALFFGAGFAFYAVHTGVDSIVPVSVAWKDIPEEGAKLLSVFSLFLGTCAMFMALADKLSLSRPAVRWRRAPQA
jgi:hypothetical protein